MPYPIESGYTVTLKHNTVDNVSTATDFVLFVTGTFAKGVQQGNPVEFLGGFTASSKLKRREYKLPLLPFVFPDHMSDFDNMEDVVLSGEFMWLYSDGVTYPLALADIQVYVSTYNVEHNDEDGTKRVEITLTTSDYV